jgi:hypothetical protein
VKKRLLVEAANREERRLRAEQKDSTVISLSTWIQLSLKPGFIPKLFHDKTLYILMMLKSV